MNLTIPNEPRAHRPKRTISVALVSAYYTLAAAFIAIAAACCIVMLERYSDQQALIETSLSSIQACSYHLAFVEEQAHADKWFSAKLNSDDNAIDHEITRLIQVIDHQGDHVDTRSLQSIAAKLDEHLDVEYGYINRHRADFAELYASRKVDPLFDLLQMQSLRAATNAHAAADHANVVAIVFSVLLVLLAAGLIGLLFRHHERSRQTVYELVSRQETLQRSEHRFHALLANASDLILIVGADHVIKSVVSPSELIWQHEPNSLQETSIFAIIEADNQAIARALLDESLQSQQCSATGEVPIRDGHGKFRPAEIVITNLLHEQDIEGFVVSCRDISERKAAEAKIEHQAFHDPLTDLPNRALFMERLSHALLRSQRSQQKTAVIFLDLDHFKVINDSLGHEAGDTLLKAVAERLRAMVRPGDTVSRLGGDEFTILLEDVKADCEIIAVAERIANILQIAIPIAGREISAAGSMGIAVSDGNYQSAEDLLRDADTAMYQAKGSARGHSIVFDTNMNIRAVERLELEIDLHDALERDEFRIYYQPIISLESGIVNEVEALIRWQHPTRGLIAPCAFIPIAEECGMIVRVGTWVLEMACTQVIEWQKLSPNAAPLSLCVNVSVRQLHEPNFVAVVSDILDRLGMDPTRLKLEITESVMVRDPLSVAMRLGQLREIGIRISVDDFGTGYSSMSYLSGLPIDTIKIDRSFINKMAQSNEDEAIVSAIVTLAKALKLKTTAEGIETPEQRDRLRSLDCDSGQGYFYSPPLPAAEIAALLDVQNSPLASADENSKELIAA